MNIRERLILLGLFAILSVLFFIGASGQQAVAADRVEVEALGFFSHPPMQETADTIQSVSDKFGGQVRLIIHDETTADGEKFMEEKGLSGHLPMLIYINGSLAHKIGNRTVVFRDFVGQGWTGADLKQVIQRNLDGQNTKVEAPAGADTEQWDSSAIPGETASPEQSTTAGFQTPTDAQGFLYVLYALLGVAFVATLTVAFVLWRRPVK